MAKIKEEYQNLPSFNVFENGKTERVRADKFAREWAKYVGMGYGRYFDISDKEANELAAKGLAAKKEAKLKQEKHLASLKEGAEKAAKDLVVMSEEVKKLDKNLNASKKLTDEQQKQIANVTNENAKLKKELEDLLKKQAESAKKEDSPK